MSRIGCNVQEVIARGEYGLLVGEESLGAEGDTAKVYIRADPVELPEVMEERREVGVDFREVVFGEPGEDVLAVVVEALVQETR